MMPPAATRPAAYILLWPAATIIGTSSAASAAASAAAEPDSEARTQDGEDGDVAQAAPDVADQRQRDIDDALGEAAACS